MKMTAICLLSRLLSLELSEINTILQLPLMLMTVTPRIGVQEIGHSLQFPEIAGGKQ